MQMLPEEETSSLVQSASLIGHPGLMLPGLESLWNQNSVLPVVSCDLDPVLSSKPQFPHL